MVSGSQPAGAENTGGIAGRLTIDVLGPMNVFRGGVAVQVGPDMVRKLLAVLALSPGQTVPRAEIAEHLWGADPPGTYVNLLQVYVSRLRGQLRGPGDGYAVVTWDRIGYRLELEAADVDLGRFTELFRDAENAFERDEVEQAIKGYGEALDCWRGPLLVDVETTVQELPVAVLANQRRVTAAVRHAQLCRSIGQYQSALDRLHDVLPVAALHEGVHAEVILTLAAAGDRTSSLAAYETIRTRLAAELGLDPGPELRAAHLQVLRTDGPAEAPGPANDIREPSTSRHEKTRGRRRLAVAALVVLISVVSLGWLRLGSDSGGRASAVWTAPRDFTTALHWNWAYAPSLGVTAGASQSAEASVFGLQDGDYCAGFRLRVGADPEGPGDQQGVLLTVCRDKWEIEARPVDFRHGEVLLPAEGKVSVALSADNVATISFDGMVIVRRQLRGSTYPGRNITPAIYQGDGRVLMAGVRLKTT
jgi:DNA-binding SARP family transcriptional activator